jgi:hypothetical protein
MILQKGEGWRIGWNPEAKEYQGLVGAEEWAMELTAGELEDFCCLLGQIAEAMAQMAQELMAEERIACEVESHRLWLEGEGFPHAYSLRLILRGGRRCEGNWPAAAVLELVQAARLLEGDFPMVQALSSVISF